MRARRRRRRMPRPAGYHWEVATAIRRADGKPPCRWCYGPVERPRRCWCGNPKCLWEWQRRISWDLTRAAVYDRDRGVCADCGEDTEATAAAMIRAAWEVWDALRLPRVRLEIGHTWEADHVVPVAEGGDWFDLANLQTLCLRCHRTKTAEQAARRAPARRRRRRDP